MCKCIKELDKKIADCIKASSFEDDLRGCIFHLAGRLCTFLPEAATELRELLKIKRRKNGQRSN
jgi:hypothetical protein